MSPAIRLPRLAVVGRLVDERIAVVDLMQIDRDVRRARVVSRRLDVAHGARAAAGPGMFAVTLVQRPPSLRVTCTWPSLVPAQITPFSSGDSAIANTTPAYSTPMLSGVRPPEIAAGATCRSATGPG